MLTIDQTTHWLKLFAEKIDAHKNHLNDLDQTIGDGDHGSNMARGTDAVLNDLNQVSFDTVSDVLKTVAMTLISNVGGASGPLYGTALMEMSKQSSDSTQDLAAVLNAGVKGIQKRGKAERGDKTMLDVWMPNIEALENESLTYDAIQEAVDNTKDLQAKKGRAAFFGERTVGHLDPGAVSSGYLFEALLEVGIYDE